MPITTCKIILTERARLDRVASIKELRRISGYGLGEAKRIIDDLILTKNCTPAEIAIASSEYEAGNVFVSAQRMIESVLSEGLIEVVPEAKPSVAVDSLKEDNSHTQAAKACLMLELNASVECKRYQRARELLDIIISLDDLSF